VATTEPVTATSTAWTLGSVAAGAAVAFTIGAGEGFRVGAGKFSQCLGGVGVILARPATKGAESPRTARSVHGDANRTQIWAAFASPRTARSKCVGPLGWVFPGPSQNRTDSDVRCRSASGHWRCPESCTELLTYSTLIT
jgi:hypothetical protein